MKNYEKRYEILRGMLEEEGINVDEVEKKLKNFRIETPSWFQMRVYFF